MVAIRPDRRVKGFVDINDAGAVQGVASDQSGPVLQAQTWLAAQGGGKLWFPGGITYMSGDSLPLTNLCHWEGAGKGVSKLQWLADAGAGKWAIVDGGFSGTPGSIENMDLQGPGGGGSLGVKPCNMNGIKLGSHSWMKNMTVFSWNEGTSIIGDHNYFSNVRWVGNYWGTNFSELWASKGNFAFVSCDWASNNLACVHCAGGNTVDMAAFFGCMLGWSPFAFLRENYANGTPHSDKFMNNSQLVGCFFEYCGNAAFADYGTGTEASWLYTTIDNMMFTWNAAFKVGGAYNQNYGMDMPHGCLGGYVRMGIHPLTQGALGVFRGMANVQIFGVGSESGGYASAPDKLFSEAGGLYDDGFGSQHFSSIATGTINQGDLVEWASSGHVQRATGVVGTRPILGVALTASTDTSVLVRRDAFIFYPLCETVAAGVMLAQKTGSYHLLGLASNYPANPVIGYTIGAGGNAGATASAASRLNIPGG